MKVKKKKILAIFPCSGKKSQQSESERMRESSPREADKTRGKRKGKKRQGRTTEVKGDNILFTERVLNRNIAL